MDKINRMRNVPVLKKARYNAYRLLLLQTIMTAIASILFGLWSDDRSTYSILVGGFICVIGNWFFIRQMFSKTGARSAKLIAKNLYLGEVGKVLLCSLLFVTTILFLHVQPLMFFVGYIIAQSCYWLSPLLFKSEKFVRA